VVGFVCNKELPASIRVHVGWGVKEGVRTDAVGKTDAAASKGSYHATGRHSADAVVAKVRDNDVAAAVHRHAVRSSERSARAGAVGKRGRPAPSKRCHNAARCDFADAVVVKIRDINVAARVDGHAAQLVKLCIRADAVRKPVPATRKCGYHASGRHATDTVRVRAPNENIADPVDGHALGAPEAGVRANAVGKPGRATPG
jgi:hypothetical protein